MYEGEERHKSAHAMAPSKTCARLGKHKGGCPSFRHQKNKENRLGLITESLRIQKVCDTLQRINRIFRK